jgi:hypothetical protein
MSAGEIKVIADDRLADAAKEHARQAGFIADAQAAFNRAEKEPKLDHEVWLAAFVARTPGTRLPATNAAYADEAVKLYVQRFKGAQ